MDLHQPVDMTNKTFNDLTSAEKWRIQHQKIHEQHKGHEKMHAEMVLILILSLVAAQVFLIEWKKRHYKSYCLISLLGMWIIPFILSLKNMWWRFIFTWLLFSCITSLIVHKALQKPINCTTPRLVYKWFLFLYKLSCVIGVFGYTIMLATFLGINMIFDAKSNDWMNAGVLFIFYGLYYGVLGRDVSEICTDKMASHIGYYVTDGMPTRNFDPTICAICGNKLLVTENEEGVIENTYRLTCDHVFHEFCIRGWCIIGKKQTCPYCKEKVDLKKMFANPWEKPHVVYGQLLDWIRWLVVWQPLILFIVQGINWTLGLE